MKYFRYDLWMKINYGTRNEVIDAELEWERNNQAYFKIIQTIKKRLPNEFLSIYINNYGFHDYRIIDIKVIHEKLSVKSLVSVILIITNGQNMWEITYSDVQKLNIDNNCESYSFDQNGCFDDWGYDEFSEVSKDILSHEILFASGTIVLVFFRKIDINIIDNFQKTKII